jgi:putative membrane protein
MTTDLLLAYGHFLLVFVMVACIVGELLLVRPGMTNETLSRVGRLDAVYGIGAVLLLVLGFGRVYFGLKSPDYYWSSPAFHLKLTLFALIAVASLPPTIKFISWRRGIAGGTRTGVTEDEISGVRRWLHAEAVLLVLIPLAAGLLARDML